MIIAPCETRGFMFKHLRFNEYEKTFYISLSIIRGDFVRPSPESRTRLLVARNEKS